MTHSGFVAPDAPTGEAGGQPNGVLRVVAWDDPRCVAPLEAAAAAWHEKTGDRVEIMRRPLTAFNDQPIIEMSPQCDVMIIDYPHVARALDEGAITPIEALVEPEEVHEVNVRAIGPSQRSFQVGGVTAAFASDAACHVSAHRPQALGGHQAPQTWEDVFALAEDRPGSVAVALYPTDAISCLMSLIAGDGAAPDGGDRLFPDEGSARRAVGLLKRLAGIVGDFCWTCTPQALFAQARTREEIAYIPFTFGYTAMTEPENGGWRFAAPPAGSGSLLGGAGMAVSSQTPVAAKAAAFASWYCRDEGQLLAGRTGGQPAGLAAWDDQATNVLANGFYADTSTTQKSAYVRPRVPWWPPLQAEAGEVLVKRLRNREHADKIIAELEATYRRHRSEA